MEEIIWSEKFFLMKNQEQELIKIVDINNITNKTIFIDGYNVLISVETICNQEYDSIIMCDDGILRDIKAVFGKYKTNSSTENALNYIINILNPHIILLIFTFFMTVL